MENKEVIIIGAGAAGVGLGVALKDFGYFREKADR